MCKQDKRKITYLNVKRKSKTNNLEFGALWNNFSCEEEERLIQTNSEGTSCQWTILWGHHYPNTTTKLRHYIQWKHWRSNSHSCKNPQQSSSKSNMIMYKKNYTIWPSVIYPRYLRMFQHSKINQYDSSHKQTIKEYYLKLKEVTYEVM